MIEWWGPILFEYYSATEAMGSTMITSEEWLAHPGSVGKPFHTTVHILDEDDRECPVGEPGVVWFEPGARTLMFEYHKDPEKTARTRDERGWASVGDIGYVDEDGYLYLTDRRDFMIVSGGVNIYPQEAENVLITHPRVMDAAVFGIPDAEMGRAGARRRPAPRHAGRGARPRACARRVLPAAPLPLQVPAGDRLRRRAAAPADRQAVQAAAARPLLGRPDEPDRVSAPDFPALLADLAAEEAALDRVVADLDPAAWATPTPAEGWDVRDSIAHLAWTEDLAVLALRDPDAFVVQRDEVVAAGEDDGLLGDGRAMPGVAVRDWWRQSRETVRRELATRDGRDRIVWITGPIAAMSFATARLMETWAHGLDVRAALGLGPEASARLRHVADLGVRTRRFAYQTRGRPEPVTPVRVELAAPDGASWAWGDDARPRRGAGPCARLLPRRHPADQPRRHRARRRG